MESYSFKGTLFTALKRSIHFDKVNLKDQGRITRNTYHTLGVSTVLRAIPQGWWNVQYNAATFFNQGYAVGPACDYTTQVKFNWPVRLIKRSAVFKGAFLVGLDIATSFGCCTGAGIFNTVKKATAMFCSNNAIRCQPIF